MENPPSRVLIIDTAWLGDVVFSTALLGAVSRAWPSAEIHMLVAPRGATLVYGHPLVSRVWVYDKHGTQRSWRSMRKLAHELRDCCFDVVLNAHPSGRSRLLTKLIGGPIRVGYQGFGAGRCFTHIVPNDLAVEPDHIERRINLLRALVPNAQPGPLSMGLDPQAVEWADNFLHEKALDASPLLALICGSAWETKRWPKESFAALAERWISNGRGHVLVFGGRAEADDVAFISSRSGAGAVVQETLPRVAALLARCQAAVGNDTGISFLAVAAGCPQVSVLYGSTQVNYSPASPHRTITAGVPCCLPRTGHGAQKCHWNHVPWCMNQISIDKVWHHLISPPSSL